MGYWKVARWGLMLFLVGQTGFGQPVPIRPAAVAVDLTSLAGGRDAIEKAAGSLKGRVINVSLLGGESYKINNCLALKANAGKFYARFEGPTVHFNPGNVEIKFLMERISFEALKFKMKPSGEFLDPCGWTGAFKVGGSASDVRIVARFKPKVRLDECQMVSLGDFSVRAHIGGLNLKPLQNNLDDLARRLIEDSMNAALASLIPDWISSSLSQSILGTVCSSKVAIYKLYMDWLGAGVTMSSLPSAYVTLLQPHYPNVDLRLVRFGYSPRQEPGNATTDCLRTYYSESGMVEKLKAGKITSYSHRTWLYHELRHTEQCEEGGTRENYAKRWFNDLEISLLNLDPARANFRLLHDKMPMEADADRRMEKLEALGLL